MATVTINGFIHFMPPRWSGDSGHFAFFGFKDAMSGYICLREHQITTEVPDFNPVAVEAQWLETRKEEALRRYHDEVAKINDRLSKLQALECGVTP